MASLPSRNYKNIFLALTYFKDHPNVYRVRVYGQIIKRKPELENLRKLAENGPLKNYFQYRNSTKQFIEKLVEGYRKNDYSIFHLVHSSTPEQTKQLVEQTAQQFSAPPTSSIPRWASTEDRDQTSVILNPDLIGGNASEGSQDLESTDSSQARNDNEGGDSSQIRMPEAVRSLGRELGSSAASQARIGANKAASSGLDTLGSMGKGLLNAGQSMLSGGAGAKGKLAAGAGKAASSLAARGAAAAVAAVGWPVIVIAGIAIAIALVVLLPLLSSSSAFPPFSQNTGTAEAGTIGGGGCPSLDIITQNRSANSCKYLNPSIDLFDTNISRQAIDNYVSNYSPIFIAAGKGDLQEFVRRVNYIVADSKQGQLNPALFLGYWKSEAQFGTLGSREMGCAGDNFEEQVDCALGIKAYSNPQKNPIANCARSKDAQSVACLALKSIRTNSGLDTAHPIHYPVATFDDFAEAYGPYAHLTNGSPTNCTSTYNTLISVASELNACIAATPSTANKIVPAGTGGERIASVARQIASQLVYSINPGMVGCDPNGTYGPSFHCWSEMTVYDQARDPDYLQCTEFVWAAFDKAGFGSQINEIRGGNASDWPARAKASQSFTTFNDPSQLQVGDIISLGSGGIVSHVAIVIEREGNTIKVTQSATGYAMETHFINDQNQLVVPGAGPARTGTIGFIRLKATSI